MNRVLRGPIGRTGATLLLLAACLLSYPLSREPATANMNLTSTTTVTNGGVSYELFNTTETITLVQAQSTPIFTNTVTLNFLVTHIVTFALTSISVYVFSNQTNSTGIIKGNQSPVLWVQYLPNWAWVNLDIISLLVVGFLAERKFVGRLAVFSNSVAVNLAVLKLAEPHLLIRLYADVGFVIGVVAALSYGAYVYYQHHYLVNPPEEFPYSLSRRWYTVMKCYHSVIVAIFILLLPGINSFLLQNVGSLSIPYFYLLVRSS